MRFCYDYYTETDGKITNKKYIKLRFIDSYAFMSKSLEEWVKMMKKDLPITKRFCYDTSMNEQEADEKFESYCKKGFYAYEWTDSNTKFV